MLSYISLLKGDAEAAIMTASNEPTEWLRRWNLALAYHTIDKVDPFLDPLRQDELFITVLKELNLLD